jgi:hypothetical protein
MHPEKAARRKMNSSGFHTVSLGKIPSALPLLGEASATADSPDLRGSVERIDFARPKGDQQGKNLPCASIRHANVIPYSYESCFPANDLDPGNERPKPAHLPIEGEAGCLGFFETASKESVKVDQQCQEFSRLVEPTVISFAISSEQHVQGGSTQKILNEPGFLNHPGSS